MRPKSHYKHATLLVFGFILLGLVNGHDLTAEAKKQAAKVDPAAQAAAEAEAKTKAIEAEIQTALTPLNKQLTALMMRVQARGLFSPEEAAQLVEIKYKLLDLIDQYPQNPSLAKPIYQAGTLFVERESYNDAFELFNYLAQGYSGLSYGAKAKGQIQQLEKQFGASYFSVELAAPAPTTPTASASTPTAAPVAGVATSNAPAAPSSPAKK